MKRRRTKTISVRDLAPEVARAVREKARQEGLSLNRAVARLLEEATGHAPRGDRQLHHDLDDFAGVWTTKEADGFDAFLKEHRTVDPEMWK